MVIRKIIARIKEHRAAKGGKTLELPIDLNDALSEVSVQLVSMLVERVVEKRNPSPEVIGALADALDAGAQELRRLLAEEESNG